MLFNMCCIDNLQQLLSGLQCGERLNVSLYSILILESSGKDDPDYITFLD